MPALRLPLRYRHQILRSDSYTGVSSTNVPCAASCKVVAVTDRESDQDPTQRRGSGSGERAVIPMPPVGAAQQTAHVRKPGLVALMIVGCSALAGCSAEPEPAVRTPTVATATAATTPLPSPSAEDGAAALRSAVQAYSDAYLTGEAATAYQLLSERCRKRMTSQEFSSLTGAAEQMYGSALPIKSFEAEIAGNLARVTYTYDLKAINQDAEPWVRENGQWKEDDC